MACSSASSPAGTAAQPPSNQERRSSNEPNTCRRCDLGRRHQIGYDVSGQGAPVIFTGPALADRSADRPLAACLSRRFTVFNYDRRGRGGSGDTPPYAIEREIDDIAAVISRAGGPVYLIGGSSGAVLALDAAARGLPITKLALYEPPFIVDDSRPPVPAGYRDRLAALLSAGRRGDAVKHYMTAMMGVPAEQVAAMRQAPFWAGWQALAHTLAYDAAILDGTMTGQPLLDSRWAALTVPTLVIDGGASPPMMHSGAQALALPAHRPPPNPARTDPRRRRGSPGRNTERVLHPELAV